MRLDEKSSKWLSNLNWRILVGVSQQSMCITTIFAWVLRPLCCASIERIISRFWERRIIFDCLPLDKLMSRTFRMYLELRLGRICWVSDKKHLALLGTSDGSYAPSYSPPVTAMIICLVLLGIWVGTNCADEDFLELEILSRFLPGYWIAWFLEGSPPPIL